MTNGSTGQSAEATARADGSLNIVVPGSPQDEYEVTVSNGSGSQTLQVSAPTSGDIADADGGVSPGACTALRQTARGALAGLQRSIAETEGPYCGSAESRGCPGLAQLPCAPPLETPRATCNAGQCEVTYVPLP